jgi:hypothetical protein
LAAESGMRSARGRVLRPPQSRFATQARCRLACLSVARKYRVRCEGLSGIRQRPSPLVGQCKHCRLILHILRIVERPGVALTLSRATQKSGTDLPPPYVRRIAGFGRGLCLRDAGRNGVRHQQSRTVDNRYHRKVLAIVGSIVSPACHAFMRGWPRGARFRLHRMKNQTWAYGEYLVACLS